VSLVPFVHVDTRLTGRTAGERLELAAGDRHHLRTVLRLRPGAEVVLSDGEGAEVAAVLGEDEAVLGADPDVHPPPRPALRVAQGLPKGRKLDDVVRVCTELGVDTLVPVAARRSVTRLEGARAAKAVERWQAVARAASEQARRVWRPTVTEVRTPAALADGEPAGTAVLVAHPGGTPLPHLLDALSSASAVTVAVGPEGGWDDAEVASWVERGAAVVGLGPSVLRTEHAAAAAIAVLAAGLGRWDR
jgi:16S rRNA (uracil1498-N3)-methyltransferase